MTKKLLDQLVEISYKGSLLDQKNVEEIAKKLNRLQLKRYIKALKNAENKKTVVISLPKAPAPKEKEMIQAIYPDKIIVYDIDPSLLLGIRTTDNDLVYNSNLQSSFNNIISYISEV